MNRIERIFADLRREDRRALMPFITAGSPSLQATAALLPAMEAAGASICELGLAFSDPIADGPVIQSAMTDALVRGVTVQGVFETIRQARSQVEMGLVAMVSYSIVYRRGAKRFVAEAKAAGFDGFIFPDVPVDESESISQVVREAGLTCSLLIAPTTPLERARRIAAASSGFVYVIARSGITGESDSVPAALAQRVAALREVTDLPIAVGFGISGPEHVKAVTSVADAAIVGSAVVRRIASCPDEAPDKIAAAVGPFVAELAGGLE